jgi:hypothetical protein
VSLFLVGGLAIWCLMPPTRAELDIVDQILDSPGVDAIVRLPFTLSPGLHSYVPEAILAGLVGLLFIQVYARFRRMPRRRDWISGALFLFIATATANALFAIPAGVDLGFWVRDYAPIGFLIAFYPLVRLFRHDPRLLSFALNAILTVCGIVVVHSLYVALRVGVGERLGSIAAYHTLPYLGVGFALLFGQILFGSRGEKLRPVVPLVLTFTVILFTQTRALLISCALGVLLAVGQAYRAGSAQPDGTLRRRASTAFLVTIVACGLLLAFFGSGLISRFQDISEEGTALWRAAEISVALDKFRTSPLVGAGLGSSFALPEGEDWRYIHNAFFFYLANLGLCGVAAYLFLIASLGHVVVARVTVVRRFQLREFVACSSILVTIVVFGLLQSSYRSLTNSVLLVVASAGLAAAASPRRRPRRRSNRPRGLRPMRGLV